MSDHDSVCKVDKHGLCAFEQTLDNHEVLIERCKFCNKRVMYNKRGGQIDQARYMRDHRRDTLQPFGATGKLFEAIYGMQAVKDTMDFNKLRNKKKQEAAEMQDEAADMIKTLKRTSFS